ncbi:MAG: hypothetical protein ACC682_11470 [Gemmatimonadota bacterium]
MTKRAFDAAHCLASSATLPLREVLAVLEDGFDLPPFHLDGESTWEYAYSERPDLGLNVTRARSPDVIETWIDGTPPGSTYQIMVYTKSGGPTHRQVAELLSRRCAMNTYHVMTGAAPPPRSTRPARTREDPAPSGWSLPFSWIFAIGFVALAIFGFRSCM